MVYHTAYRQNVGNLDVAVLDSNKAMGLVLNSMIGHLGVKSVRNFYSPDTALAGLREHVPHLIVLDWRYGPDGACDFMDAIRHRSMWPVCFAPIMVLTNRATHWTVTRGLRAGAQSLLVKPFSSSTFYRRLLWVLEDSRRLELDGTSYAIDGMASFGAMDLVVPFAPMELARRKPAGPPVYLAS